MTTFTAEHEALRVSFSTPELEALTAPMEKGAAGLPLFTEANFMALIESAEGTPYKWGGIDPFHGGADCSGLIYWAGLQCGVALPRTTEAEWAGLPHSATGAPGRCPEFKVPADGGTPPQHVGIELSAGVMIDDPYTGAVVRVENIPNIPSIQLMGYCILPFVNSPTPPPPAPPAPPVNLLELFTMNCIDPTTGGTWVVDPSDGHIECFFGAPYLGGLNSPANRYGWQQVGYIAGITSWTDPNGQEGYAVIVRHQVVQANGAFYSTYTFERNGSNVAAMGGHEVALIG
jgi:hypothetical protein